MIAWHDARMKPRPQKQQLDPNVLYRVRDREWAKVWGENLTMTDAIKLKEQVVTGRKSKTARLEPMSVPPPDWYTAGADAGSESSGDLQGLELTETVMGSESQPARAPAFGLTGYDPRPAPCDGMVTSIPPGCDLYVDEQKMDTPCAVKAGQVIHARPLDPELAVARAAALAAVRASILGKTAPGPRKPYRDRTVKVPPPRAAPPPPDKTVSKQPVFVRLDVPLTGIPKPPPAPQKVAELQDGDVLPDGALSDDDLPGIASDLGGHETQDDIAHAERERDAR